jgi:hypothetical protein
MSTHFFGIKDWTFPYSHSVGRNEFAGRGSGILWIGPGAA